MRRSPAVVLAMIIVASVLGVTTAATAIPPGNSADTGNLYLDPTSFEVGQSVKLTANFPSGVFTVTYFKKVSDTEWTSIGTDASNSSGNAYLNHVVNAEEEIYARITSGGPEGRTESKVLTPTPAGVIAPTGPDTGNLYQSPTTYAAGDSISLTANFPSGTFPITLYKEGPVDTWTAVDTKTSNSSGNATFSGFAVTSSDQRVFARKADNNRTEIDVISPAATATLSVRRDCPTQNCAATATAYGELDPAQDGRSFKLQRKSGSSWVSVAGAANASTAADGTVEIQFPIAGVPQWTARAYRLTNVSGSAVTSREILFMPGPTQLGTNVLRVDVDKGIYPTTKGPEYTGVATLSVNGVTPPQLDHAPLENFGVRGNSTVKYVKKPYKLKFLGKPPSGTSVFGMPRAKNWTLLASFKDLSLIREKAALDLGRRMNHITWTPDSRYVEMFVNDQYRGSYLMTESVKIDGDRVDVDEETGMIMETDGDTVVDSSLGFMSTIGKIVFAFKDPDEVKADSTGVTTAKREAIKDRINAFESALYNESTRDQYPDFIDVNSAIDFHLIQEFVKSGDGAFWRSHYFSWDQTVDTTAPLKPLQDGKFNFGPAWDFDGSAGNPCCDSSTAYVASPTGWMMRGTGSGTTDRTYRTHWFAQLFKEQSFEDAVEARWAAIKGEFARMYLSDTAALTTAIGVGAENDRDRWDSEPKPRASRGIFAAEVAFVKNWYKERFAWMDEQLSN